jgi:hypothetical protein
VKFVLSALVLAFASAANAAPAVGDSATFSGTWGADTLTQTTAFTAFNASTQQFTQATTTTVGKEAPVSGEELVNLADTASDAAMQDIVTNCANYGGAAESVTTVAGTFPTCKLAMEGGGFVWIGVVPFAVVRFDTIADGKPLKLDLTGFTNGQP